MNFLAYFFFSIILAVVFYAVISLFHLAFVHIKACIIRRKLSNLAELEKKDD